ncbi:MAPEG family protein [Oceanicaulis alexandrii]|uniref:MAPEG family protein n=1 Tax=Oceanicaulis alexandrii TaxID=153233 RepID=UPI0035D04845
MTAMQVASLYVGLNLLILLILGANVVRYRLSTKTSLGMGENPALERACRAHANGAEWTPGVLIALVVMALIGAPIMALHAIGVTLTVARGIHGWGVATQDGPNIGRFLGALMTLIVYAVLAVGLVLHAVTG